MNIEPKRETKINLSLQEMQNAIDLLHDTVPRMRDLFADVLQSNTNMKPTQPPPERGEQAPLAKHIYTLADQVHLLIMQLRQIMEDCEL